MLENNVVALVEKEIEVLEELNNLSLSKKEALLNDNLDSLEEIILKEENLTQYFQKIDDACSLQVQFFLGEGFNAMHLPPELKELLLKMRKLALQLRMNNQFNQDLIEDSLGLIKFTLNTIMNSTQQEAGTYSCSGKTIKKLINPRILDYKG